MLAKTCLHLGLYMRSGGSWRRAPSLGPSGSGFLGEIALSLTSSLTKDLATHFIFGSVCIWH